MEHKHLDAAALDHLLAEDRTPKQNEQLFHLLAVCPRCYEVGGWLLELHRAHALPPIFGPLDAALARSRADAPELLEEILPLDPEERLARLHPDPRLVSWGFCELLVQRSSRTASEQAAEAIHLADLAVHVADRISESGLFEESWSTSSGASPGPLSRTRSGSKAISKEPRAASTCPTPGGRRGPGASRMPWAMSPFAWT